MGMEGGSLQHMITCLPALGGRPDPPHCILSSLASCICLVASQEKLWQGLKGVTDQLVLGVVSMWHLQRVVAKKRDPLTHVLFLDVLCPPGQPLLTEKFWCVGSTC
jgi:hypothetical protein